MHVCVATAWRLTQGALPPAGGNEPVDLLLLMSCSENDTPKVEELLSAGANPTVKVRRAQLALVPVCVMRSTLCCSFV